MDLLAKAPKSSWPHHFSVKPLLSELVKLEVAANHSVNPQNMLLAAPSLHGLG